MIGFTLSTKIYYNNDAYFTREISIKLFMKKNKRIVFVISSLGGGGAERVISILANHLVSKKYQVTVVTYYPKKSDWYRLNRSVNRVIISWARSKTKLEIIRNLSSRITQLRKTFIDIHPDVIISFTTEVNVTTLLASFGLGIKVIISERVDPTMHQNLPTVWKWLRRLTYPFSSYLVVQTATSAKYFSKFFGSRVVVIPNPVVLEAPSNADSLLFKKPFIVAIGRLVDQKGFDLLIESYATLANNYPNWNLVIIGEGDKRSKLEQLISRLGLSSRILLIGRVKNPQTVLHQADIFVLSSRYEGFPNALLEAMANGLPAISFNCPSGPAEIIRHNFDGILVPPENREKLSMAIGKLMSDKILRRKLGKNAKQVTTRFSVGKILGRWEGLFE